MAKFELKYARIVILGREIEADNEDDAMDVAWELETKGELGIDDCEPVKGSWLKDISDYEEVWEVEHV